MSRTKKRSLHSNPESTYATDPSASGSTYVAWPSTAVIGELQDQKEWLDTNWFTGRNFPTPPVLGRDGWAFDVEVPEYGLTSAAGDGVNASTVIADHQDHFLANIFGPVTTTVGEGVNVASTTSNIVIDTPSGYVAQQLVPVFETGLPFAADVRTQWSMTTDGGTGAGPTTFTTAPNWVTAPTTAAIAYGIKLYQPSDNGGPSVSFVYTQDDVAWTLGGGKCIAASKIAELGQLVRWKLSFAGDRKLRENKGSLPVVTPFSRAPCINLQSPLWFNGTRYATRRVQVDFGLNAAVVESSEAVNGRADYQGISIAPRLTFEPLFTGAIEDLKRNGTQGPMLLQSGAGVLTGGTLLNTTCLHFGLAVAREANPQDDKGMIRAGVQLQAVDQVLFGGAAARFVQYARA